MVIAETSNSYLMFTTVLFAFTAALLGVFLLNKLFGGKLKHLFDDNEYFIFFLLVTGYTLYAMGELTWYLILKVFKEVPAASMPDVYWTLGVSILLVAFAIMSVVFHKRYGTTKNLYLFGLGAVLLGFVIYYISSFGVLTLAQSTGHLFIAYFYPIMSSLLVIFSANIPLYYPQLEHYRRSLLLLFFANIAILLGDLLYIPSTLQTGAVTVFYNLMYTTGYLLASLSFLSIIVAAYTRKAEK